MDTTDSGERRRRVFTTRSFRSALLSSVILFSLSVKSAALFTSQLMYPTDAVNAAQGHFLAAGILGNGETFSGGIEIRSVYTAGLTVRDSAACFGIIPGLTFGIDSVFLPAFGEIDDAGISRTITPFAVVVPVTYTPLDSYRATASVSAYAGYERVGSYYNRILYYGSARFAYRFSEEFGAGIYAGFGDEGRFVGEAAAEWMFSPQWSAIAGFELKGYYMTAKLGSTVRINERYGILVGGSYTLLYGGWSASAGFYAKTIPLFASPVDAALTAEYAGGGTVSIGLNLIFSLVSKHYSGGNDS